MPKWLKEGDAYLLVLSTEDPSSAQRVREIYAIAEKNKPVVLVANSPSLKASGKVSRAQLEALAQVREDERERETHRERHRELTPPH